jgi:transposase
VEPVYKKALKKTRKSNAWLFARQATESERKELKDASVSSAAFTRDRARIILFSMEGKKCKEIAEKIGCEVRKVRIAVRAFNQKSSEALRRAKAPGAKPRFTKHQVQSHCLQRSRELKCRRLYLLTHKSWGCRANFTTWSLPKLKKYFIEKNITDSISIESIRQIIRSERINLKRSRRRQYSNGPEFDKKNSG